MNIKKDNKRPDHDLTIVPNDGHQLPRYDMELIDSSVKQHPAGRSRKQIIKNQMLSVLYRLEEFFG